MFSYYLGRLESMQVIIYTSSIITPNLRKSPLNNPSSVIQSSGSFVISSNSHFVHLFCSLFFDAPVTGWNLLFNFPHARKVHLVGNSLVTNFSTIWKHTVSSCSKISSLYAFLFSCLSIAYFLVFSSLLSAGIFTVNLRMILYQSYTAPTKNLTDHIRHLSLSPLNWIIMMLFSSMLLDFHLWISLVSPPRELQSTLEGSAKFYSAKSFYTNLFTSVNIRIMTNLFFHNKH